MLLCSCCHWRRNKNSCILYEPINLFFYKTYLSYFFVFNLFRWILSFWWRRYFSRWWRQRYCCSYFCVISLILPFKCKKNILSMEFWYNCRLTIISVLHQGKKKVILYRKKTRPSYRSINVYNAVSFLLWYLYNLYLYYSNV